MRDDLILLDRAAEIDDLRNTGHLFDILVNIPIGIGLDRCQIDVLSNNPIPEDFTVCVGIGAEVGKGRRLGCSHFADKGKRFGAP